MKTLHVKKFEKPQLSVMPKNGLSDNYLIQIEYLSEVGNYSL